MAEKTNISFAHHTGSPWIGCTKVNKDCANCYADWIDEKRFSKTLGEASKENPIRHWGKGAPRFYTKGFWTEARKFNRHVLCDVCGDSIENGKPGGVCQANECGGVYVRPRMFPSLCDWLDPEVPISWLVDFLKLVYECQNLTWMLFTKRPELFRVRLMAALESITDGTGKDGAFWQWVLNWIVGKKLEHIPQHVWIFASAGCQETAESMIPELLKIPAVIHGVSCEPMTGPIEFDKWFWKMPDPICPNCPKDIDCECGFKTAKENGQPHIDVVIFGGESDQERPARPCNLQWIADGVKQCRDAMVLPYVKQLGSHVLCDNVNIFDWPDDSDPFLVDSPLAIGFAAGRVRLKHKSGADLSEWPEQLQVQELPNT